MKILIVKIGAIGDVVMARSMLAAAKALDKNARVTWVCGRSVAELVRAFGGVDEVLAVPDRWLLRGNYLLKAAALFFCWFKLLGRSFDLVATGHSDWRYRLLSLTAMAPVKRSFHQQPLARGRFHGDEYARLVSGQKNKPAPRENKPRLVLESGLKTLLAKGGGKRVLMFPGGARNLLRDDGLRRWPLENYARLAGLLVKKGCKVVLGGAAGDRWVEPAFEGLPVASFIGACGLVQTAALAQACDLVITHDSGPMHLAAWVQTPVISLFGPTDPKEKAEASARMKILWGGASMACRPCYDGKNYAACLDPLCLRGVKPERAAREALKMLKAGRR